MADRLAAEELQRMAFEYDLRLETEKKALRFALLSRVVTLVEMARVAELGEQLFEPYNECFFRADVQKQMAHTLLQQFKIRTIHEQAQATNAVDPHAQPKER